jgi:peptidoglycan L-alanyl-D-glutamate endopeptidase CwlK
MSIGRCDDLDELHPKLKELALKLLDEAKRQGLNAKIIDTFRSPERQDHLYAQGRTRAGNIVTNATGKDMSSYHNWRLAFDCIQNVPGKEYDAAFLAKLGKIGQSIGLEWGGGWSTFKDAPHFQYTFGLSIAQLKAGKKPTKIKEDVEVEKRLRIRLNGVIKEVIAIEKDGNNFVKLQDIRDKQIDISYDVHNKIPIVEVKEQ